MCFCPIFTRDHVTVYRVPLIMNLSWSDTRRAGYLQDQCHERCTWLLHALVISALSSSLHSNSNSLVSTNEELLGRKSSGSGLEIREYGCRGSTALTTRHLSIHKSWHYPRRQTAIAQSVLLARGLTPQSLFVFLLLFVTVSRKVCF
jgi:hypothetical protein